MCNPQGSNEHLSIKLSETKMNDAPQWPLVCAGMHFESPRHDRQAPSDWVVMTRSCLTSQMVRQTGLYATSANGIMSDFCYTELEGS